MAKRLPATATDRKRNRAVRVAIGAIACIPLIYGGALVWSNQDPTHRLDEVPAAVVNLDQPVSSDGDTVAVGKSVTANLLDDDSDQDFAWTKTDAAEARAGLKDGRFLAVLTLPKDLSQNAVSMGSSDPMDARGSTVTITTNDAENFIMGTIAKSVGTAITQSASQSVSADYLRQVYVGFNDLGTQLNTASDGAQQLASGADELKSGTAQLSSGAAQSAAGAQQLTSGLGSLSSGAQSLATGTSQVASGASSLASGSQSLATGADTLSGGLAQLNSTANDPSTGVQAAASQLAAGAQQLATGLNGDGTAANPGYIAGVNGLAESCAQLRIAGLAGSGTPAGQLCAAIDTIAGTTSTGAHQNSDALSAAATALAGGTAQLDAEAPALANGIAQASAGAAQLGGKLHDAASGAQSLASGAHQSATGAQQLAAAAAQAHDGAAQLSAGTAQLADGAQSADSGAATLASGSGELAGKLADGAKSVPSFTAAEKAHLSKVASQPVSLEATHLNPVPAYGYGLAPYFMSLGMWVGGLAIYMVLRAIPRRSIEKGRPGWVSALLGYARGAGVALAQAAGMYLIVTLGVGVHPAHPVGLALFLGLAGLAFTAVNHALMIVFGSRGRFLGLLLIVLQLSAAGATYPIQTTPGFFQFLHGLLPLTYAVDAIRSLIAGGTAGVGQGALAMVCWLIATLAVSVGVTAYRKIRKVDLVLPDFAI
ncbi:YhgE/Pip domain-containing protein [Gryllotalpicola protaetiae]|uniref:YhgE/Pip domain-containing protein n=1 Tax=Gryllotalpicola protaetiae TaxID=2419771 RepID=A0A387BQA8_9MICO|nr:YhgE/Pip domain-containing protein [Gryllotalpicola protaetiae]AYG04254.1 YhgE/Pip domain-containing protein [Gryllotalpicola protaetiae]